MFLKVEKSWRSSLKKSYEWFSLMGYYYLLCLQERPQMEAQRSELLESITSDLQFLRDLEDKSLGLLQKSEGKCHMYGNLPVSVIMSFHVLCYWRLMKTI